MIKVEKDNGFYAECQACHTAGVIYSISFSDGRYGTEVHLCKDCLDKLTKEIDKHLNEICKENIAND